MFNTVIMTAVQSSQEQLSCFWQKKYEKLVFEANSEAIKAISIIDQFFDGS